MKRLTARERLGGEPRLITDTHEAERLTGMEIDPAFTESILLYPFGGSIEKCSSPQIGPYYVIFGNADVLGTLAECEQALAENWPEVTFESIAARIARTYQALLGKYRDKRGIAHDDPRPADDYCDTNQIMLDAFEVILDREPFMPSDVDAGLCTEEESDRDNALMDTAFKIAGFNGDRLIGADQ